MYRFEKILKENKNIIGSVSDIVQPIRGKVLEIKELISDLNEAEASGEDTTRLKSAINNLDKQIENLFYEYYDEDDSDSGQENEREKKINSTDFPHIAILEQNKEKLSPTLKKKHNMWTMQKKKYIKSGSEKVFNSILEQSKRLSAEYQAYLNNPNAPQHTTTSTPKAQKGGSTNFQEQLDEKNRKAQQERQQQQQQQSSEPKKSNFNFLGIDFDF